MYKYCVSNNDSSITGAAPAAPAMTSLLHEIADALIGAVAVYGMADIRAVLRAGTPVLRGNPELFDKALSLPIHRDEMLELLQTNEAELRKANVQTDLYLGLLQNFGQLNEESPTGSTSMAESMMKNRSTWYSLFFGQEEQNISFTETDKIESFISVFDDENSSKELLYYISVDSKKKLLKVVFRGSVTVGDWMADIDSRLTTISNPLLEKETIISQSKTVSIHQGFYSYLFGTSKSKNDASPPSSKYDLIVQHLTRLLKIYTDYKIRVSGHSLGGALSTAFAYMAACDETLPKPILCISFASPRVGNLEFARSFQECEISGRLMHIRVANDQDLVTKVPDRLAYAVALTNSIYRHVGIEVKLYRGQSKRIKNKSSSHPQIHFPTCHTSLARHLADDVNAAVWNWFTRPITFVNSFHRKHAAWHGCKEYSDRLAQAADFLNSLTIEQLMDAYIKHCKH